MGASPKRDPPAIPWTALTLLGVIDQLKDRCLLPKETTWPIVVVGVASGSLQECIHRLACPRPTADAPLGGISGTRAHATSGQK